MVQEREDELTVAARWFRSLEKSFAQLELSESGDETRTLTGTIGVTLGCLLAGAMLGYAALAAGPLPGVAWIASLAILLSRFKSQPEQPGTYMVGAGSAGAVVLSKVIAECYFAFVSLRSNETLSA